MRTGLHQPMITCFAERGLRQLEQALTSLEDTPFLADAGVLDLLEGFDQADQGRGSHLGRARARGSRYG